MWQTFRARLKDQGLSFLNNIGYHFLDGYPFKMPDCIILAVCTRSARCGEQSPRGRVGIGAWVCRAYTPLTREVGA